MLMSDQAQYGTFRREEDGSARLRFERHLKHPVERVWDAITNPDKLALWLARFTMELKMDAPVLVQFTNNCTLEDGVLVTDVEGDTSRGHITALKEGELIEYTWQWGTEPVSVVRWELQPHGDGECLLVFTHQRLSQDFASVSAGWHVHLDMLEDVLDRKVEVFHWTEDMWRPKFDAYSERLNENS